MVKNYPEVFRDRGFRYTKTFAPVELIAVSVLISQYMDKRPEGLLRGDIVALREQLRALHADLTLNDLTWRSAWNFIDDLERYRGTTDGSTKPKKNARLADRALAKAIQSSQEAVLDPRVKKGLPKRQTAQVTKVFNEQNTQEIAISEPMNAFTPVGRGPVASPTATRDDSPEVKDEILEDANERNSESPMLVGTPPRPTLGRSSKPVIPPIASPGWAQRPVNFAPAMGRAARPLLTVLGTSLPSLGGDGSARKRVFEVPTRPEGSSLIAAKRARLSEGSSMVRHG